MNQQDADRIANLLTYEAQSEAKKAAASITYLFQSLGHREVFLAVAETAFVLGAKWAAIKIAEAKDAH